MSVKKYDSTNKILKLIAGGTLWADCPIGTINAYGGTTAPEGWLLCQGQALSRIEYKDLFAVIGTNFGSGDGSTTFNLPDLRGEFLRGAGNNSHAYQGNGGTVGQHQDATGIPNVYVNNNTKIGMYPANKSTSDYNLLSINHDSVRYQCVEYIETTNTVVGDYTGSAATYTARPTNTSVNYIMKAKQAPIPADLKAALEDALDDKNILSWS